MANPNTGKHLPHELTLHHITAKLSKQKQKDAITTTNIVQIIEDIEVGVIHTTIVKVASDIKHTQYNKRHLFGDAFLVNTIVKPNQS